MRGKRLRQTLCLYITLSPWKRTKYLKDHNVFADMGENCSIMDRKVPLYANLIKLGNNVHVASKVDFIVHDIAHVMINKTCWGGCPKRKNQLYRDWRQRIYRFKYNSSRKCKNRFKRDSRCLFID